MINPTTHAVSSFATPTASSNPQGITSGPDGNLWFTEQGFADSPSTHIGMINPTTHAISEFKIPNVGQGKGVPVHPMAITAGSDGNLWFTTAPWRSIRPPVFEGNLGEINPTTHAISLFQLPTQRAEAGVGITAGPDGNIWFSWESLGEMNLTTHALTFYSVTADYDGPFGVVTGPDGNLWFTFDTIVNGTGNIPAIGMFNPTTQAQSQYIILGGINAQPWGITAGPDGNLWFAIQESQIGQINPTTGAITEYAVPYASARLKGSQRGPMATSGSPIPGPTPLASRP
jgi:virginiamycin B lyase